MQRKISCLYSKLYASLPMLLILRGILSCFLAIIAKKKEPPSGKDAYSEYMHLYESVCGYTNDAGEERRQALMEGLNRFKKKQVDIITGQNSVPTGGLHTCLPQAPKTVDKRIPSMCSPKKNKNKKR